MRKAILLATTFALCAAVPVLANVGTGYSLFGSAKYVSPGDNSNRAVKLVSNATANPATYSGIDFSVPANLTINDLNELSTDYDFIDRSCALGSPRFAIQLSQYPGKNIFVYIGNPPNYTGCAKDVWTPSGNLLTPSSTVDTSQLPGGTFYDTWAAAQARYSGDTISDISLVSDNGPSGSQKVLIDNTDVNGKVYTYEFTSADDCKNGGWKNFTYAPGPFKNQGQCVSYFERHKHHHHDND